MNKKIFYAALTAFLITFLSVSYSQAVHRIEVADFSFTPDNIVVTVGDTVRWSYNTGQFDHNVKADDGSFTSGPPAPAPWTFSHVFTAAGINRYYCEPHGGPGGTGMSGIITVENPVSVPSSNPVVIEFRLNQNYPNPFNPSTIIKYQIPEQSLVTLKVYSLLGNEISTLVNEKKPAGEYEIEFKSETLTSGVYFYTLTTGNFTETRKMILLR